MKCAVVSTLISLVFVSQASAVLRPLFPIKPSAPFNGELIVIGDDFVLRSAKKPLMHHRGRHSSQCLDRLWPCTGLSARSRKDLTRAARSLFVHDAYASRARRGIPCAHEAGNVIETHEQKGHFVERRPRFGVASFILDIAWQRAYERSCQVAPHVPRGARRD